MLGSSARRRRKSASIKPPRPRPPRCSKLRREIPLADRTRLSVGVHLMIGSLRCDRTAEARRPCGWTKCSTSRIAATRCQSDEDFSGIGFLAIASADWGCTGASTEAMLFSRLSRHRLRIVPCRASAAVVRLYHPPRLSPCGGPRFGGPNLTDTLRFTLATAL